MARLLTKAAQRLRISIDVKPEMRRALRTAAARRDLTVRQYIVQVLEERLREDFGIEVGFLALTAQADPVLARLWDHATDAEYDRR